MTKSSEQETAAELAERIVSLMESLNLSPAELAAFGPLQTQHVKAAMFEQPDIIASYPHRFGYMIGRACALHQQAQPVAEAVVDGFSGDLILQFLDGVRTAYDHL